ncbi:hypothetical protein AWH62_07970 [Maricaulis sp. W15]|uniref:DUF3137 domain-containing protein n=1 Tax=Maricaulis sp. W15 TaxID=1772333 RepID=UPI00094918E4|nr:DUF3137 domain-containing protein [Maricaulis sp. W15]OLF74067.1 hypothetical protein AWH62_07970 [Maricaulis sp. W15]
MDARFSRLWDDKLEPWLSGLEGDRLRFVRLRWYWTTGGVALGAAFATVLAYQGAEAVPIIMALIIGPFLGYMIGSHALHKMSKRIKLELNSTIAGALGLVYRPKPQSPARFDRLRDFGLLPSSTRQAFEDHYSGTQDGCEFELYEAHLEQRRRSNKRTYYVTVFRGVIIRINFPRKVEGITVITRDQGWFNGLQAFGRSFGGNKLERIGLVDPVFEKAFEVYGNDQVLARYMLTPSFMERLLALETSLKGKNVRAAFDQYSGEGELLIAAETGNLFEIGSMSTPLTQPGRFTKIVEELGHVTGLIELLIAPAKLDEHEERQGE